MSDGGEKENELRQNFQMFCPEGESTMNIRQCHDAIVCEGWDMTWPECYRLIAKYDADSDKQITEDEFVDIMKEVLKQKPSPEEMAEDNTKTVDYIMDQMDKDSSGTVDRAEFKTFLKEHGEEKMTDEEVDELFQEFDTDENGITREELLNYLNAQLEL